VQAAEQAVPARRRSVLLPLAVLVWAAALVLFLFLAIMAAFFDYFPADVYLAHRAQEIDVPCFGGFVDFVNALGLSWVVVPLTVGLAVLLAMRNAWLEGALVAFTFLPRYVNGWIKDAVDRPRPSRDLVQITSHVPSDSSFPSGHTLGAAVLFGTLFFVMPALVPWRPLRWLLQGGCLLMVAAAGPARIYVGVHWPSDVLGGYVLALLFLIPALAALFSLRRKGNPQ
jgi:undecaprenyl-diphosphatase